MQINNNERYFFITRGIPGSGKSTFLKNVFSNRAVIIEPDEIRRAINGLIETAPGKLGISQANPGRIWKLVNEQLEAVLAKNPITILDATNTRPADLATYEELANKYKVNFVILDFSHVSLEECKQRNAARQPEYKVVPEDVLDRMHIQLGNLPIDSPLKRYFIYATHPDVIQFVTE